MKSRLPRFTRTSNVPAIRLTDRDREIIKLVHRHRFLRSSHITALVGGSPQQLSRRLQLLYHNGYLERPRAQLQYYERGGSRSIAYGLGNKGGTILRREFGIATRPASWSEKNRTVGRLFLEHALLVSDVMVALELACRKRGIRFIPGNELGLRDKRRPFRWRAHVDNGVKLGVMPDRVFALEYADRDGRSQRVHFLLEADRGTMPVKRRNLTQTSFYRKLLAYEATWTQQILKRDFGIERFRVLTVTTRAARMNSLVETCAQLKRGHRLFLFADQTILGGDILSARWQTGKPGESSTLLD